MLSKYLRHAMKTAEYERLEDGAFGGKIPACPGVLAFGGTLYECQKTLRDALEGWLIVKLRHGDALPVFGSINLNPSAPRAKQVVAHG